MPTILEVKKRLDEIIKKARVDLYKPIQIAEVLRRSRLVGDIDILKKETYQNPSLYWRNEVTKKLLNKISTSSARYQHDVWNNTAMPPDFLILLDTENKRTKGGVERYIYLKFKERQQTVTNITQLVTSSNPKSFNLNNLLEEFSKHEGIRRSIDKVYETITYSLFETLVVALETTIQIKIPLHNTEILEDFSDLMSILLGLNNENWESSAHVYRVGVTNASDRGLDMWSNFGLAIQIKHLTLDPELAESIVAQIESDNVVIVCRDVDIQVIEMITQQISWGKRVKGIICESELIYWYERCLRGQFAEKLAQPLLDRLAYSLKMEFPQVSSLNEFLEERGYLDLTVDALWIV